MLSGFLFEIDSMPAPIRAITWLIPARYFVSSLKTVFLAGDTWAVFVPDLLAMAAIGVVFFVLAKRATRSEEHTSELQSLMRISYAVFCLKKKKHHHEITPYNPQQNHTHH